MRRVKIAELKNRLSAHLRAVERGAEVEVTDRDRPIARIIPATRGSQNIRILHATHPFGPLRKKRYPPAAWAIDSTTLLRDERGSR